MGRGRDEVVVVAVLNYIAIIFSWAFIAVVSAAASQALLGCENKCGNLEIPYPFGLKEGCYLDDTFLITCNKTHYHPPKPFLRRGNIEVTDISILSGELQILQYVAQDCYTQNGDRKSNNPYLNVTSKFTISNTKNKFIVIGCDTYAYLYGPGRSYRTACVALCDNIATVTNGSCLGYGCCELDIPNGLHYLDYQVSSFKNHSEVMSFNPCGYAFIIEQNNFNFSSTYIRNFTQEKVPMVIDWGIKNDTCLTPHNKTNCNIDCGPNAIKDSSFSLDGSQHRCKCLDGFQGNPYLPHQGCQDIDECENGSHECESKEQCVNKPGNYTCICLENYKGDGRRWGKGCTPNSKSFIQFIIIGIGVGLTTLVIGITCLYLCYKKWKFIQQKQKFFKNNGGLILQQHLSQWQSPTDMIKIFTQTELEKATNKFDESVVIGKGGHAIVFKGVLEDGLVVAIKRSKFMDQSQISQFINEVIILSQINHRHVVKLLGCCLETQVPLLVYEFITNGTLFDHIHDRTKHNSLSWETRLKIASETASVVSYLHSSASTPIIHRDIKSTNILLDNSYTTKVSDFGASKFFPMDQTQISTIVQGTLGYLDPEYLSTSKLTEKSDVYSFGIVLLELITGKKAASFNGPEIERNLAMYVLCVMKEDRLVEIVEKGMATEGNIEQIKEVAKLAKECVRVKGEERPTMKKVAMELEGLRAVRTVQVEHSWANNNNLSNTKERVNLLDGASGSSHFVVSGSINAMDSSIKAQSLTNIPVGR